MAADISSGEKVVFKTGSLSDAIMASTCIPGVFMPAQLNGRMLVDGAIVENVPVKVLNEMGAKVCQLFIRGVHMSYPVEFIKLQLQLAENTSCLKTVVLVVMMKA